MPELAWWMVASLALFGCSTRLATTKGPFRDMAQPGPCVIAESGKLECWAGGRRTPIPMESPNQLASGGDAMCAKAASGTLQCWSKRLSGSAHYDAIPLSKLRAPLHVASDANNYCALQGDGTVACWSVLATDPREVANVRGAQQVSVFVEQACALLATGHVTCWTTTNSDPAGSLQPAREVPGLENARTFALGSRYGCAVLNDGGVSCWGNGNMGELGRPVTPHVEHAAERIPALDHVAEIVAAGHTACARSSDGSVRCWGRNMACELGIRKRKVGDLSEQPLLVARLEPSRKLSMHGSIVCSLSEAGNLTCWGGCRDDNDPNVHLDQ